MTVTCARPGCDRPLPKRAIDQLDGYCSSTCCRIEHGLEVAKPREYAQRERRCVGCGCEMDDETAGCSPCRKRHYNRVQAGTAEVAA